MMLSHTARWLVAAALLGSTLGCLGPRRDHYQSSYALAIADPSESADAFWESIQETLRRQRFLLDRVDRRAGVVTTIPMISQALFEVWRHDVDTWPDLWESTLNSMRRWVEVQISHGVDNVWLKVTVLVHKERLSALDRQFNSTGAAYQYFGDSLPTAGGESGAGTDETLWLDEGRDSAMEEYLLRAILERSGYDNALGTQTAGFNPRPETAKTNDSDRLRSLRLLSSARR